jgi:hypothetical protein
MNQTVAVSMKMSAKVLKDLADTHGFIKIKGAKSTKQIYYDFLINKGILAVDMPPEEEKKEPARPAAITAVKLSTFINTHIASIEMQGQTPDELKEFIRPRLADILRQYIEKAYVEGGAYAINMYQLNIVKRYIEAEYDASGRICSTTDALKAFKAYSDKHSLSKLHIELYRLVTSVLFDKDVFIKLHARVNKAPAEKKPRKPKKAIVNAEIPDARDVLDEDAEIEAAEFEDEDGGFMDV